MLMGIMEGLNNNSRIRLNVSGIVFEVERNQLCTLPDTRLANLQVTDANYDAGRKEWYFSSNSALFPYILDAFR